MKMRIGLFMILGLFLMSGSAFGAGFALIEQSVKGLGNAFSGGSASADNPGTVYFNPAGMTRLEGKQVNAALHVIIPSAEFQKDTATNVAGTPLSGGNGGDGGVTGVAPNLYYTETFDTGWSFGLGINAPFGLSTKYDRDWVGRYHAVESDVITINVNPSAAYKVNEQLSLGFGLNVQYIDATLSSMIDGGLLTGGTSQTADVFSELSGDSWGYGFNFGVLYEFDEKTRAGFSYRSEISQELEGDASFSATNAASTAIIGLFPNQGIKADIDLPASAQASLFHQYNEQWAVMADIMWTDWSTFDKLVIDFDQGILAAIPGGPITQSVTTENWDDNFRYSVGTTYTPNDTCALRAGIAYDETPIPDPEHRTPRIPGNDRLWLALGAGYEKDAWSFDFGYAHLFVDDSKINQTTPSPPDPTDENFSRGNLVGEFENSVDIVSASVNYRF